MGIAFQNTCAKLSCSRWNKIRATRKIFRNIYRNAAERRANRTGIKPFGINTYPWPYCDENFAAWEESSDPKDYTLISDPSGCVIRYSTSYCAWKIREHTGTWPQKKSSARLDAKNWEQFLAEAGYRTKVPTALLSFHHRYVGINPDETEWGLVVWYEMHTIEDNRVMVSSYVDHTYKLWSIDPREYTWILIE